MSSFNYIYPNDINRLRALYRGVEANVEATLIHFDQAADCESEVLWSKLRSGSQD